MPVKFVAEVVKGLFGISEGSNDETETETSITVERETGEEPTENGNEAVAPETAGEPADESEDTVESEDSTEIDESEDTVESEDSTEIDESEDTVESEDSTETEPTVPVEEIRGIGPTYSERLADIGVETVGDLAGMEAPAVADAAEVSESRAADWITQAEDW
jgi:predicted flap endonuclease-1-like 5' DNA nuclease